LGSVRVQAIEQQSCDTRCGAHSHSRPAFGALHATPVFEKPDRLPVAGRIQAKSRNPYGLQPGSRLAMRFFGEGRARRLGLSFLHSSDIVRIRQR
jgi:hypothetical protein